MVRLDVGAADAWLVLCSTSKVSVWQAVPMEPTASGALVSPAMEMALLPKASGTCAACFLHPGGTIHAHRLRAPNAVLCAGVDRPARGAPTGPYAMAYEPGRKTVLWSVNLPSPALAVAPDFGGDKCVLVRCFRLPEAHLGAPVAADRTRCPRCIVPGPGEWRPRGPGQGRRRHAS